MHYHEISPDPRLRPYVKCFWTLQGIEPEPAAERVLPDGRCELVLHCGDAFQRIEPAGARMQPRDLFVGPTTRAIVIKPGSAIDLVAVRFHPGGAALLIDPPLHELRDLAPAAAELDVRFGCDLFEALHERSTDERIALVQAILLQRLARSRADTQMLRLQHVIERARGNVRVESLARHAGLSLRHFQRRFQNATGVSPKVLCRLNRLQNVLTLARDPSATLAQVAAHAGYADQSHFNREFREFVELAPNQYFSGQNQLNEMFFSDSI